MLLEKVCVMTDELETMACEERPSDQMGLGGGGGAWGRWSTVLNSSSLQCKKQEQSKIVGALVALHHRHRCMCEGRQLSGSQQFMSNSITADIWG